MVNIMNPLSLEELIYSIFTEYTRSGTIFDINNSYFYKPLGRGRINFWGKSLDLPSGIAAGPHTQLAQNIIVSFLTGARFIELKTVQENDSIEVDKPCIYAVDEGYNVEWSSELKIEQAIEEYIKSFLIIILLKDILELKSINKEKPTEIDDGFIFVASIGYSYDGIRSEKVNKFIDEICGKGRYVSKLAADLIDILNKPFCRKISNKLGREFPFQTIEKIARESYQISNIFTLSTMHGTRPEEIESIIKYLFVEKKLNLLLKVNPTLLGYHKVKSILDSHGFGYIKLSEESFAHDLILEKAFEIVERSLEKAKERRLNFGIKVSNTLATINHTNLKGEMSYLSGRAIFPVSLEVAEIFRKKFKNLTISFSAGINQFNIKEVLKNGIYPVTIVTDILKPGGYYRLYHISKRAEISIPLKYKKINASEISSGELYQKILSHPFFPLGKKVIKDRTPIFDCFIAPCVVSCPIHQDIPEYLRFLEKKDYKNAIKVIFSKNPLPFITATICTHFCMYNCTRNFYDKAVEIRAEKLIASKNGLKYLKKYIKDEKKNIIKNNIKIAIIGGGPAGISCANFLARTGFDVTIFEKERKVGGIVSTIIPKFRIKKQTIEKDIELLKLLDVKFINKKIENISELKNQGYQYIIVSIGSDKSKKLNFEYCEGNVFDAIEFLKAYNENKKLHLGKQVVVIGGGNSAMDAARAAIRVDKVKYVTVVYRRTENELPADREEYENACKDGISFRMLRQPISYKNGTLTCEIMKLAEKGKDGRRTVVPSAKYEILKADSIIFAIGEDRDKDWFTINNIKIEDFEKLDKSSFMFHKEKEGIYFVGDCTSGSASVVEAISDARVVTDKILENNNIKEDIFSNFNQIDYLRTFDEKSMVDRGKRKYPVKDDYVRCLSCNIYCGRCVDVCPNRANRVIPYSNPDFKDNYQIIHLDYLCNECGNCETFCPYEGFPYKDKFTIFDSLKKFNHSENSGIFVEPYTDKEAISIYIKDEGKNIIKIESKKIEGQFRIKENSDISRFAIYLINNYPEIFKNNYNLNE